MACPRPLAVAAGLLGFLLSGLAAASELSWSGPPECHESEQLSFQVEQALGAPLAETGHVHLQVHVERVAPDARALLRIASDDAPGARVKERLLVAPDCSTLVDTLAVAITLAVEAALPSSEARWLPPARPAPTPTPALARETAATPPPIVTDAAPNTKPAVAGSEWVPSVSALLVGDVGSLPDPALGVAFGVQLGGAWWQLQLLGTLWLEQHTLLAESSVPGAGAYVRLATGALLGCTTPFDSAAEAWSMSLCAGLEIGRLSGEGTGVDHPRDAQALWLAPSVQGGVAWRVPSTRLSLSARAGVALPLERQEFVLEGLGTVHQPASLAARASFGMDVAFE